MAHYLESFDSIEIHSLRDVGLGGKQVIEKIYFSSVSFDWGDFESIEFRNCAFIGCTFRESRFQGSVFTDCIFYERNEYRNCEFIETNLEGASFVDSDMTAVDFRQIEGFGIEFKSCSLQNSNFYRPDFSKSFSRSICKTSLVMQDCDCKGTEFEEVHIENIKLIKNDFTACSFKNVSLEGCDFIECQFKPSASTNLSLYRSDLRSSDISGLDPSTDRMQGVLINESQALSLVEYLGVIVA